MFSFPSLFLFFLFCVFFFFLARAGIATFQVGFSAAILSVLKSRVDQPVNGSVSYLNVSRPPGIRAWDFDHALIRYH